jgi:hypothetical protein
MALRFILAASALILHVIAATPQAQAPLLDAVMGIQLESQRRVALSRKNTQQHLPLP